MIIYCFSRNLNYLFLLALGQYLIADSAYGLTNTVIPAYKAPTAYILENTEFNYCLAKARVRNEHTIGILKNRWSLLHEICLHLYEKPHMIWHIKWIYTCIILHNMLAKLGDSWEERVNNSTENPHPNEAKLSG